VLGVMALLISPDVPWVAALANEKMSSRVWRRIASVLPFTSWTQGPGPLTTSALIGPLVTFTVDVATLWRIPTVWAEETTARRYEVFEPTPAEGASP
jgi:hypothetical protein